MYYDTVESGKRIKDLRKKKGLTQEQFAEVIGMSTPGLGDIERGKRGTSVDTLAVIASELNTSLDYLALGKEIPDLGIDIPEDKKAFALKMLKAILENM